MHSRLELDPCLEIEDWLAILASCDGRDTLVQAILLNCDIVSVPSSSKEAAVFVDWNSQLRRSPSATSDLELVASASHALRSVGRSVSRVLLTMSNSTTYRVTMRLYHGWTVGFTRTRNHWAVRQTSEFEQPDSIFGSTHVLARGDIQFGDRLLDAVERREFPSLGIHLPNTLRRQSYDVVAEKMVDTALACDLLSWARGQPQSVAIVVSSDDDMVPPVFTAEAWMASQGGAVKLMRPTGWPENKFLKLEDLLC